MMFMPVQIKMFFPKIQEEFGKIIQGRRMVGFMMSVDVDCIRMSYAGAEICITPDMEYEELVELIKSFPKEVATNGE